MIFMFSGQGSQYYGMGKKLYHSDEYFRETMDELDKIPNQLLNCSIIDICYNQSDYKDEFSRLLYTHPALFMVQYSLAVSLIKHGIKPDCVIGTSLGESVSFAVAGVIEPSKMLEMIIKQALIVERICEEGMMVAVLASYDYYLKNISDFKENYVISINFEGNFVIAGLKKNMIETIKLLKGKNICFIVLPVKYAYHTKYIESVKKELLVLQSQYHFSEPIIKIISSLRGDCDYKYDDKYLWKVISERMFFRNAINDLDHKKTYSFIDLGPSGTLSNFIKYNQNAPENKKLFSIMLPYGSEIDNYRNVLRELKRQV